MCSCLHVFFISITNNILKAFCDGIWREDSDISSILVWAWCSSTQGGVCFFRLNLAYQVTCFDQKNIVEVMLCQLRGLLVSVFAFGSHYVHNWLASQPVMCTIKELSCSQLKNLIIDWWIIGGPWRTAKNPSWQPAPAPRHVGPPWSPAALDKPNLLLV